MDVIAREISTLRRDIFRQHVHVMYFAIVRFNNDRQFHFPYRLFSIEIREPSILSLNALESYTRVGLVLEKINLSYVATSCRSFDSSSPRSETREPITLILSPEIIDCWKGRLSLKIPGRCSATFGHRAKHPLHAERALVSACRVYVRTRFPSFSKDNTVIFEKLDWNLRGDAAILCRIFNAPTFSALKPIATLNIEERGTWRSL